MSAPTSEFSELSIAGDMPPTQDQARRLQHAVGTHGQVDDGENNSIELTESPSGEEEGEEEEEPRPSAVLASSGITYSICGLDAQSMARALVGLTGRFEVVGCCVTPTGYDFRLSEQPQVNIASDAYTCTCAAFKSLPNVACQHIFVSCPLSFLGQLEGSFFSAKACFVGSGFLTSFMVVFCPNDPPLMCPCRAMVILQGFHLLSTSSKVNWRKLQIG